MDKDLITSKRKKRAVESDSEGSGNASSGNEDDFTVGVSDDEVEKAQGRLKEAKKYLADLTRDAKKSKKSNKEEAGSEDEDLPFGDIDAEEIDREIIASRLQRDTLVSRGRAFENIAVTYQDRTFSKLQCNTPDGRVPNSCAFSPADAKIVYLTTKGNCVYQYALAPMRKLHTFKPTVEIDSFTSLAVSFCGNYLVCGSRSGKIVVWSARKTTTGGFTYKQLDVLTQHRGAVLALSFSRDDLTFYSSSADRTVKIWSLESGEALYIDTLFGHQDSVPSLGALGRETCVTVGSRDRTARLWKVTEETQLVFRGPEATGGSQDVISIIEEGAFVTGTDLGAISLWNTRKKKPLSTVQAAHEGSRPIGALAAHAFTDLVASGSADGYLRLWRAAPSSKELSCVRSIPLPGFINSLAWSEDGKVLAVAVGREPRLGRWETEKSAKNQLHIFNFNN